ncbi:MAG: tetratricopeptide repeat protein [Elusimicrobia bacterium]|nr:tetratricopeptide repeat protein [Elusimicrobiota bacterium]
MRISGGTLLLAATIAATASAPVRAASEATQEKAFDAAMLGLKEKPSDRGRLLLAVEDLPENSAPRARLLAAAAAGFIEKNITDYAGYLGACKSLRVLSKHAEALSNCRKALELDPMAYPAYRELGLTYSASGSPRKAAETLSQGIEISSSSCQAYYYLARVLEKRGDYARAASYYRKGFSFPGAAAAPDYARYSPLLRAGLKRTTGARPAARTKPASRQQPAMSAAECREKLRAEFLRDSLGTALTQSEECMKLSPADPDLAAERAPLLVRLGKYEEGVKEYERAAALYKENKPSAALCRIKAAQTWLKLGDRAKAAAQYKLALQSNPEDMNALEGLAAAQEALSDSAGAEETYSRILKLEPGNKKAKTRLEELKAASLTDAQILDELKLRGAAGKDKKTVDQNDVKLFKAMKAAELGGAVDLLKEKAAPGRGLSVRHKTPDGTRVLLTAVGYKTYISLATREAVKFFESEKVGLREIFKLRSKTGAPLFSSAGMLTPEGETVWRAAVPGKKSWLMPYEAVPASPQAKASREAEERIASLQKEGYQEISEPEYLWLLKATHCPAFTLKSSPVNAVKELNDGVRPRYLLCTDGTKTCMNQCNSRLPEYIGAYRGGNAEQMEGQAYGGFFGSGAKKRYFCENGEVWMGEIAQETSPCSTAGAKR